MLYMMNLHRMIEIVDPQFFKAILLKSVHAMRTDSDTFKRDYQDTHPLDLNIKQVNLPAVTDPDVLKAYESIFTYDPAAREAATEGRLVDFLMEHPMYAAFGFHRGFGTNLFNSLVQNAYLKSGKDMDKFY